MKNIITAALVSALVATASSAAATNWINGRLIKPHTIAANRLSDGAVDRLRGRIGPPGPQGPTGPAGTFASALVFRVSGPVITVAPGTQNASEAACPDGSHVLDGGYEADPATASLRIFWSVPTANLDGWDAGAYNFGSQDGTIETYALCYPS